MSQVAPVYGNRSTHNVSGTAHFTLQDPLGLSILTKYMYSSSHVEEMLRLPTSTQDYVRMYIRVEFRVDLSPTSLGLDS